MNFSPKYFAWVAAIALLASGPAIFAAGSGNPQQIASVRVGSATGPAISRTFMGLGHEWGNCQHFIGDSTVGVNHTYRQLLENLTAYRSGPLILRIGGDSTDSRKEPAPNTLQPFAEVARATGARFTLGVNLGTNDTNLAVDEVKAYFTQMPEGSIYAIEIGNEPDLYAKNGKRSPNYSYRDYVHDFDTWKANLLPLLPAGVRLMGPAWSTKDFHAPWAWTDMESNRRDFAAREAGALSVFSQHYYVTNPHANPPMDFLLTPKAATDGPSLAAAAVALAHAHGSLFRMGELNSISNGGVHGISDAFGAALWSIDTMFEYVKVGVDGVNWQSGDGNYYSAFYFNVDGGKKHTYELRSVNPLYYGLLFFQAATGNNARLLQVDLKTRANLKAWATSDASGTPRLAILNKDENLTGSVAVTIPGYSHASIVRLMAPSYTSTSGVTFGGQSVESSPDGKLQGPLQNETVAGADGVFQIPMPITSAALVVFSK
jgi:hypothetical protein